MHLSSWPAQNGVAVVVVVMVVGSAICAVIAMLAVCIILHSLSPGRLITEKYRNKEMVPFVSVKPCR